MLPQIAKNMTRKLWKLLVYTLASVESGNAESITRAATTGASADLTTLPRVV
jgi:hypothetical protein